MKINRRELAVAAVVDGEWYSHTPVLWLPLQQWQSVTHAPEGTSTVIVPAFMAVFTIQRTRDIAVLKALGATNRWVIGNSLVQAGIVLVAGAAVGSSLGAAGALAASTAVPVQVDVTTVAIPLVLTVGRSLRDRTHPHPPG